MIIGQSINSYYGFKFVKIIFNFPNKISIYKYLIQKDQNDSILIYLKIGFTTTYLYITNARHSKCAMVML